MQSKAKLRLTRPEQNIQNCSISKHEKTSFPHLAECVKVMATRNHLYFKQDIPQCTCTSNQPLKIAHYNSITKLDAELLQSLYPPSTTMLSLLSQLLT